MHSSSDYLYFVPLPDGPYESKQVRLVSSVANPGATIPAVARPMPNRGTYSVWNDLTRRQHDHFQAIPLSDGKYVMFIDQSTMNLCLGCDVPQRDSSRRSPRIMLLGPSYGDLGEPDAFGGKYQVVPCLYTAAPALDKGYK